MARAPPLPLVPARAAAVLSLPAVVVLVSVAIACVHAHHDETLLVLDHHELLALYVHIVHGHGQRRLGAARRAVTAFTRGVNAVMIVSHTPFTHFIT